MILKRNPKITKFASFKIHSFYMQWYPGLAIPALFCDAQLNRACWQIQDFCTIPHFTTKHWAFKPITDKRNGRSPLFLYVGGLSSYTRPVFPQKMCFKEKNPSLIAIILNITYEKLRNLHTYFHDVLKRDVTFYMHVRWKLGTSFVFL